MHHGRVHSPSSEPPLHNLVLYCYAERYGVVISKRRWYDYAGFSLYEV
jgi:hypothetical protein